MEMQKEIIISTLYSPHLHRKKPEIHKLLSSYRTYICCGSCAVESDAVCCYCLLLLIVVAVAAAVAVAVAVAFVVLWLIMFITVIVIDVDDNAAVDDVIGFVEYPLLLLLLLLI